MFIIKKSPHILLGYTHDSVTVTSGLGVLTLRKRSPKVFLGHPISSWSHDSVPVTSGLGMLALRKRSPRVFLGHPISHGAYHPGGGQSLAVFISLHVTSNGSHTGC